VLLFDVFSKGGLHACQMSTAGPFQSWLKSEFEELSNLRKTMPYKDQSKALEKKLFYGERGRVGRNVLVSIHKIVLLRATNYKQEQPIDIDPNTILQNSLIITTNFKKINEDK
jgi:hypothetical protein